MKNLSTHTYNVVQQDIPGRVEVIVQLKKSHETVEYSKQKIDLLCRSLLYDWSNANPNYYRQISWRCPSF